MILALDSHPVHVCCKGHGLEFGGKKWSRLVSYAFVTKVVFSCLSVVIKSVVTTPVL